MSTHSDPSGSVVLLLFSWGDPRLRAAKATGALPLLCRAPSRVRHRFGSKREAVLAAVLLFLLSVFCFLWVLGTLVPFALMVAAHSWGILPACLPTCPHHTPQQSSGGFYRVLLLSYAPHTESSVSPSRTHAFAIGAVPPRYKCCLCPHAQQSVCGMMTPLIERS